jgi:hypothetical protein
MTILSGLRDRISGSATPANRSDGHGSADQANPPFPGYEDLNGRQVIDDLSGHSQIELEAVESYERAHKSREPVLDKLRWMRGREPLPGYDALDVEEIVVALKDADLPAIKKVRGYERKFANRRAVLEEVASVHSRRLAAEPASAPPAYEPRSAR